MKKEKNDQLLIKINKEEKKRFIKLCEQEDSSASRELRKFISEFIKDREWIWK